MCDANLPGMNEAAYTRFPTISGEAIVFVCEDDLWSVPCSGGSAQRLTVGAGEITMPRFSPDGLSLAFVSRDEAHPEVYVMPAQGGAAQRLTFLGAEACTVCAWASDGSGILFSSDAGSPFLRHTEIFAVPKDGGLVRSCAYGQASSVSVSQGGRVVLGRNNNDPARWKRYRGGTAGDIWIDAAGDGEFRRLIQLDGNLSWPMWLQDRIFFIADHEGVGNLYSCSIQGTDLRRHTSHRDYYVRFPSTDGRRIAYSAGGELCVYDSASDTASPIPVRTPSQAQQSVRRFVDAADNLEHFAPHPQGHSLALIVRGQPFSMPHWEEAVTHHGAGSSVRYRLAEWLHDGERFVAVDDAAGFERIAVHSLIQGQAAHVVTEYDVGRITELAASPASDIVAFANHRHELLLLDLAQKNARVVDRSPAARISGLAWSGDGRWVAYSWPPLGDAAIIRVVEAATGEVHDITSVLRTDQTPSFDADGKYLYFLSTRDFNPVYDALQFNLGFPHGMRPFLVTLRKDICSPFNLKARPLMQHKKKEEQASGRESPPRVEIEFEGIADRIVGFPVDEGRYEQVAGVPGRAVFTKFPVRGSLQIPAVHPEEHAEDGTIMAYDFEEQRVAPLAQGITQMRVAGDCRTLVYQSGKRLRAIDALADLPEDDVPREAMPEPGRRSGWIDLARVSAEIDPRAEWAQMYREAWRLQRESFWDERMSHVDWQLVFERYARLLPRIRTRAELSDLIWEMQGELGTSHAYEMGGDHRKPPQYQLGFLGADMVFDESAAGYRITRILRGDSWDRDADSPLNEPGAAIKEGDVLVGVGGRALSAEITPQRLLVNSAGREVVLAVKSANDTRGAGEARRVVVKSLRDERPLRYRAWVNANRLLVHQQTGGRVGYVHIPDMGPWGFAEFHRGYLTEFNRQGLVVDVRFNRGGHVSSLLLEKLIRKRAGYDVSRWGEPIPYPLESVAGPMVAITNQFAGSDGDIFSHCFKLYKLGPLIGKRTWGGVIGIWPRHTLVDGTVTTQPEFSFYFVDVGWKVENYGTDPDVDVDIAPQDYRESRDPQMEKALDTIQSALKDKPVSLPDFSERPDLSLPRL